MGFLKREIVTPLIDTFGDSLMNSSVGKAMYQHIDGKIDNLAGRLGKNIADTVGEHGLNTSAASITGGTIGGIGALLGGGMAAAGSGLAPVLDHYLNPVEIVPGSGLTFSDLPAPMKERIGIIVRRAGI